MTIQTLGFIMIRKILTLILIGHLFGPATGLAQSSVTPMVMKNGRAQQASSSDTVSINRLKVIPGTTPSSLSNGDIWTTPQGIFVRINNQTIKLKDYITPQQFGAVGDGVVDDTAAIQAAINYTFSTPNFGGSVIFPDGRYKVSSPIYINGSGITISSATSNGASIVTSCTTCNIFEMGNTAGVNEGNRIIGIGFSAEQPQTSGTAIYIHNAVNLLIQNIRTIDNIWNGISLQGDTGPTLGIHISHFDLKNIRNIGIDIGSVAGATDTFLQDGLIRPGAVNAAYGIRLVQAYGVYGQNVDITNAGSNYFTHSVLISPGSGQQSNAILLTNFLCDSSTDATLMINGAGTITDLQFVASWFGASSQDNGVTFNNINLDGAKLTDSHIHANNRIGILLNAGKNVMLSNNFIFSNSRESTNGYSGITVAAGVSKFSIIGNQIGKGGFFQSINAAGTQKLGIDINIGSSNGYVIMGNRGEGNTEGILSDGGTGSDKFVSGNISQ